MAETAHNIIEDFLETTLHPNGMTSQFNSWCGVEWSELPSTVLWGRDATYGHLANAKKKHSHQQLKDPLNNRTIY
jgi:hypothetical protein